METKNNSAVRRVTERDNVLCLHLYCLMEVLERVSLVSLKTQT